MDFLNRITKETLDQMTKAFREADGVQKAVTLGLSATPLVGTPIDAPSKLLVPFLAPFRQSIARVTKGGPSWAWKRITGVTPTSGFFPAEGTKANAFALTTDNPSVTFRSYGRSGSVTWEAQVGGIGFEDARARDEMILAMQVLKEEELVILGGNRTAITPPQPTVTGGTGGALSTATYYVAIAALTMEGVARCSSVFRPAASYVFACSAANKPTLDAAVGISQTGTEGNSGALTGTTNSLVLTWTPVAGAVAYAVYIGTASGSANLKLQFITTFASAKVTSINTTGALASAITADATANTAAFDGIIPQLTVAGSGAYVKNLGAALGSASGRGLATVDAMLDDIYDRTKVEPDRLVMGWTEKKQITDALVAVTNDRLHLNIAVGPNMDPGTSLPIFDVYKSTRGKNIVLEENPNIPGGTILALIDNVPYADSNIPAAWGMVMGADLTRLDYGLTAPKYEYEVRAFGALCGYAPALQGIIYNVFPF